MFTMLTQTPRHWLLSTLTALTCVFVFVGWAGAQQAPQGLGGPPIRPGDRVYTADQTSNTVSVIDPVTSNLLGTIPLGNPQPDDLLGALYNRQIGAHGLGFSPDGHWLAVVNVTSNSVALIETASNKLKGVIYLGRAPHEAFFTPDGKELWVAVRGENYVSVIDPVKMAEIDRIPTVDGVAMVAFRPDGKVAFIDSSRTNEVNAIDVASRKVLARVPVVSVFSPNLLVTPDGKELWLTHKDVGKTTIIDAQTFAVLSVLETGPVSNHVNFVSKADGDYAYISVGSENAVKVVRRGDPPRIVGVIKTGATPHGLWPSPDSTRVYVGLEDGDAVQVIDTSIDQVIATISIGQAPQALVYVARGGADGTADGLGMQGLGMPVFKIPLRASAGSAARGSIVARRTAAVDQLAVDVDGLAPGRYRVLLTDRVARPFRAVVAIDRLQVGQDGKGKATAAMAVFGQRMDDVGLEHVVVEAINGAVALTDGGVDALPGPLALAP